MRVGSVVGLILMGMMGFGVSVCIAQSQSSASAFVSSGEPVRASIGTFVFEQGSSLGLELAREEPCTCLCEPLVITGMRVLDGVGNPIFVAGQKEEVHLRIPYEEWTGR